MILLPFWNVGNGKYTKFHHWAMEASPHYCSKQIPLCPIILLGLKILRKLAWARREKRADSTCIKLYIRSCSLRSNESLTTQVRQDQTAEDGVEARHENRARPIYIKQYRGCARFEITTHTPHYTPSDSQWMQLTGQISTASWISSSLAPSGFFTWANPVDPFSKTSGHMSTQASQPIHSSWSM